MISLFIWRKSFVQLKQDYKDMIQLIETVFYANEQLKKKTYFSKLEITLADSF